MLFFFTDLSKENEICRIIKEIFYSSQSTYGSLRVYEEMKLRGIKISKAKVERYMCKMGLKSKVKRRRRVIKRLILIISLK